MFKIKYEDLDNYKISELKQMIKELNEDNKSKDKIIKELEYRLEKRDIKITMYELLGLVKDDIAPRKIKYENNIYVLNDNKAWADEVYSLAGNSNVRLNFKHIKSLNDEVEILEDTNEITAEQIMMATDTLNRLKPTIIETIRNWNKVAETIKNNFSTLKDTPKEEKTIPEKIDDVVFLSDHSHRWTEEEKVIVRTINEIIDCLEHFKSKGDE